jgi:hypothetical protein
MMALVGGAMMAASAFTFSSTADAGYHHRHFYKPHFHVYTYHYTPYYYYKPVCKWVYHYGYYKKKCW